MLIEIKRSYMPDGSCVIGKLTLPDGWSCFTMERPWLNNQPSISCIPEGLYSMGMRSSSVVTRTSQSEFIEGWEIQGVVGRSYIMIHPGNWAHNSEGCILPGDGIGFGGDGGLMVKDSRSTFRELMRRLAKRDRWLLQVTTMEGGCRE
jgi:hypothetical protein